MHTGCDKCGSSDARYLYKNGTSFCFSCRTSFRGNWNPHAAFERTTKQVGVALPDDACTDFPKHVVAWVAKYELTVEDLLKHGCKYSPKYDQLLYVWKEAGRVVLWQGRNFGAWAKQKCFTQGTPDECLPTYGTDEREAFVIVEDPVSAMKLTRYATAMPCLGSDLSKDKLCRLVDAYASARFLVWLDGNMLPKAQRMAQRLEMLGVAARVIYTTKDPKEVKHSEMQGILAEQM